MANKVRITERNIAAALKATAGKVTLAADKLGCSFSWLYARIRASEKLQGILERERENLVDLAEIKLKQAVMNGEAWAVCFALKCQGKGRGYVEKQAIEHSGNIERGPTEVVVKIDGNWYGNANRLSAVMPASSGDGSCLPCPTQNSSVRSALGKNGNGSNGNGHGPRAEQ